MLRLTGGQVLAKSLQREGVRVIFGLPGVQLYHATDALYDEPDIRFIATRHEQGAAYMAFGYSAAGGGIGTALVVPGPGLLNASAAVGTAYATSCPMLLISGEIPRDSIGAKRGELHEVDQQLDSIRPVTKWASSIMAAGEVAPAVREAFRQIKTGRPRPAAIDIPMDVLSETAEVELLEPITVERLRPDPERIRGAADILASSKRPVIWAGGGVVASEAYEALENLAEHLQAGVVTTTEAKGSISERHHLSLGCPRYVRDALDDYLDSCDVVLAVGSRLSPARLSDRHRIVQIDVDEEEIGRHHGNTYGVLGDARLSFEALYRAISESDDPRPSRRTELEDVRARRTDPSVSVEPQASFVRAMRAAMPDDGILVEGVTQVGYYSTARYPVYTPRTYISSSYFVNLGFAYPTALGAKVARPDRAVVAVSGDGGFLYNSQEMATAVKYGINAVVIVFNDNAFGNVKRDQKLKFGGRDIGVDLHNPDFMKLAQAYGVRGMRADGPDELEAALRQALDVEAPTLIEVPVGEMPEPW